MLESVRQNIRETEIIMTMTTNFQLH